MSGIKSESKATLSDVEVSIDCGDYTVETTITLNNESPPVYQFIEKVDVADIIEIFKDKSIELDYNTFNTLIKFIQNNGELEVYYKTSEDSPDGRLYCVHGLQRLAERNHGIRSRLCKNKYADVDFNNCHIRILYKLCKDKGIDSEDLTILGDYANNRQTYLDKTGLTKQRVLEAIYDPRRELPRNPYANRLLKAVSNMALSLGDSGSEVSKIICNYERKLLDQLIKHFERDRIKVISLIFDGLVVSQHNYLDNVVEKWNIDNKEFPIAIKPWKTVKYDPVNLNKFDFKDPTIFNNLSDYQGVIYNSQNDVFFHIYKTLVKTVRTTNWSVFYTKNNKRNVSAVRKLEYTFKYKNGGRINDLNLKQIMETVPRLFVFDSITYFEPSTREFSLFPGFLPDMDLVLPNYEEHISPILNHIREVWCSDDMNLYEFVLDWFASIVQIIPFRTETILLLTGDEGTGKSCVFEFIQNRILGTLCLCLTGCDKLTRNFNAHLAGKILVCLEELKGDSDANYKHDLNRIKQIITADKIDIERKNVDVTVDDNGANLIGFSNYNTPLPPVTGMNRRIVMSKTNDKYKGDKEYFTKLVNFLKHDQHAPACLLHFLLNRTIDHHRLRFEKPETRFKQESQWHYTSFIEKTLYYIIYKQLPLTYTSKEFMEILPNSLYNKEKPTVCNIGRALKTLSSSTKILRGYRYYTLDPELFSIKPEMLDVLSDILGDTGDENEPIQCEFDEIIV